MMRASLIGLTTALLLSATKLGRSELLYDNGAPNRADGYEMTAWILADDFTLQAPARLENVKFWSSEEDGAFAGSFVWQVYANGGNNVPELLVSSGTATNLTRSTTGLNTLGLPEYLYTFDITPVSLPSGSYWLALHNGPHSSMSNRRFYWETTNKNTTYRSKGVIAPFTGPWLNNAPFAYALSSEFAFQLQGVPGPRIEALTLARTMTISFATTSGHVYRAEYKNDVDGPAWIPVPGAETVPGTGDPVQVSDLIPEIPGFAARFYRLTVLQGTSRPTITALRIERTPVIRFSTIAGEMYRVEYASTANHSDWRPLPRAELIPGTGSPVQVIDPQAQASNPTQRFYRVLLL